VAGVKQPNAARPHRHEWYLEFPQSIERWDGVLKLDYTIGKGYTAMGRAYKYSDRHGAGRQVQRRYEDPSARRPDQGEEARLSGFECRRGGPATYAWSRFDNNYTLRLKALVEPCHFRRAVLEGDWHFLD
jgi:hypothetical protein